MRLVTQIRLTILIIKLICTLQYLLGYNVPSITYVKKYRLTYMCFYKKHWGAAWSIMSTNPHSIENRKHLFLGILQLHCHIQNVFTRIFIYVPATGRWNMRNLLYSCRYLVISANRNPTRIVSCLISHVVIISYESNLIPDMISRRLETSISVLRVVRSQWKLQALWRYSLWGNFQNGAITVSHDRLALTPWLS